MNLQQEIGLMHHAPTADLLLKRLPLPTISEIAILQQLVDLSVYNSLAG
jgi:hypothetical protein